MKRLLLPALLLFALGPTGARGQQTAPLYLQQDAPIEERVEDALQRLTLEEKVPCATPSRNSPRRVSPGSAFPN